MHLEDGAKIRRCCPWGDVRVTLPVGRKKVVSISGKIRVHARASKNPGYA